LWRVDLREELRSALVKEHIHKVDRWTARYRVVEVDFPPVPVDPFFNANHPDDVAAAERLLFIVNAS
jgi:molybdopterin-guanine dinucleotide biosynthesis protein A